MMGVMHHCMAYALQPNIFSSEIVDIISIQVKSIVSKLTHWVNH